MRTAIVVFTLLLFGCSEQEIAEPAQDASAELERIQRELEEMKKVKVEEEKRREQELIADQERAAVEARRAAEVEFDRKARLYIQQREMDESVRQRSQAAYEAARAQNARAAITGGRRVPVPFPVKGSPEKLFTEAELPEYRECARIFKMRNQMAKYLNGLEWDCDREHSTGRAATFTSGRVSLITKGPNDHVLFCPVESFIDSKPTIREFARHVYGTKPINVQSGVQDFIQSLTGSGRAWFREDPYRITVYDDPKRSIVVIRTHLTDDVPDEDFDAMLRLRQK